MKRKLPAILAVLLVFALAGCTVPPSENLSAPGQATLLTREEAKTISLNHANATEAHITDFEIGLDEEDGVLVYEIGFDFDGAEYDYHIDAYNGKVISRETERFAKAEAPAPTEAPEAPTEAAPKAKILVSPTSKKSIGLEAAKAAAFQHAEVKSSKVQDLEVELDNERGSLQYEISFDAGNYEYEYHIDAYTGEVLHNEKEKDNDAKLSSSTTTTLEKKKIGATAAKNAAFEHAGVKAADARDVDAELDTENGKTVYEVSFDAGGYEYDYNIDAYSGKVLRHEKERTD